MFSGWRSASSSVESVRRRLVRWRCLGFRLRLRLTALGRGKIAPLRALAAELRGAAVHGLTRDEEEALRALLRKIIGNLDALMAR